MEAHVPKYFVSLPSSSLEKAPLLRTRNSLLRVERSPGIMCALPRPADNEGPAHHRCSQNVVIRWARRPTSPRPLMGMHFVLLLPGESKVGNGLLFPSRSQSVPFTQYSSAILQTTKLVYRPNLTTREHDSELWQICSSLRRLCLQSYRLLTEHRKTFYDCYRHAAAATDSAL